MAQGFEQATDLEPCMFVKGDMICLVYVDNCLFFAKDESKIDDLISSLREAKFTLTVKDDVYAFLGIEVERTFESEGDLSTITLKKTGLINKILPPTNILI